MTCPECGTAMVQNARFCHQCGWDSKLAAAGKAPSAAPDRPAWKRWSMSITLGIAAVLVLWLLVMPHGQAENTLLAGQKAPDFELEAVDGTRVHLADLRGKPVVINFWASWCTPCRKEMPDFQQMYDKYHAQGLELYGINVGESKVAVNNFLQQVGTKFPVLIDSGDKAQNAYKILPLPATFFIDRDGTIRAIYQYQMNPAQMEVEVLRILSPKGS